MPKILITNDDSFEAKGLEVLIDAVKDLGEVYIVAPAHHKSACSHSLTITKPLRFVEIEKNFYKLDDGTPADCVYLSMDKLFKNDKPDIVLSGINHGANMGEDVNYSGTAAGAFEGAIHGIPSIAFSQVLKSYDTPPTEVNWENAKKIAKDLTEKVLKRKINIPHRQILNVNIPNTKEIKGYKVTKLGYRLYGFDAHKHLNPRGEEYYWIGLHPLKFKEEDNSDFNAIKNGFISITPLKLDITAYESLKELQTSIND
ncbi:5'/3'-nucleotidase SurE [Nautilia profundicola AmH]|uniref:5'-nucleotidase SurE n=1 Tax=Nautilia profundicola (strain ATCC BAA-1463 / DSM 18972 / AmH) TaxID=598659 RepID=B9L9H3_NAUPA|nr:5'/3'-nucleotidase SurE [Nautilia profundicola]ACM93787.1 5'/3'-nucleotidase SurE [Nautilia profundicola AmH]